MNIETAVRLLNGVFEMFISCPCSLGRFLEARDVERGRRSVLSFSVHEASVADDVDIEGDLQLQSLLLWFIQLPPKPARPVILFAS